MNPIDITDKTVRLAEKIAVLPEVPLTQKEEQVLALFKGATQTDWEDWRWQLHNRIQTKDVLSRVVNLAPAEEKGIQGIGSKLSMSITPYFASLMDAEDPQCPIRRQSIPVESELRIASEELADPCGEDTSSPVHGLVHRYPDRVLFLVSEMCAMYCRFCTRSRMVGEGKKTLNKQTYHAAFDYIRANKNVRDVLISGGDPLMLNNDMLEYIIKNIKAIPHVEFLRIGTRVPVSLPQRIDSELVRMLKKHSPLWMSIHFNHPREITDRVKRACNMLADSGIPLGSQTVLLKGINDEPEVMKKLMHELLKLRVKPYYIYQCDPILGSRHFRTTVRDGLEIMKRMIGHTTGYAVPTFVIDAPKGGGKIPVSPNYIVSQKEGKYLLRNYEGEQYIHQDPQ